MSIRFGVGGSQIARKEIRNIHKKLIKGKIVKFILMECLIIFLCLNRDVGCKGFYLIVVEI